MYIRAKFNRPTCEKYDSKLSDSIIALLDGLIIGAHA
jgi:hypothetical protein